MRVGENTRRLMGMHLLTQEELGEMIGLSRQGMNNILMGSSEPRTSTLFKIAEVFGIDNPRALTEDAATCLAAAIEGFDQAPARKRKRKHKAVK
jgi:transcriptional regulator with XRE-family HTH domain